MKDLKDHGVSISISTIVSLAAVVGIFWALIKPVMILTVTDAVAEDLSNEVSQQVAPVQNAFKALLRKDINELKKEIAAAEYRERHEPESWTEEDAEQLAEDQIELETLEEAYEALK